MQLQEAWKVESCAEGSTFMNILIIEGTFSGCSA